VNRIQKHFWTAREAIRAGREAVREQRANHPILFPTGKMRYVKVLASLPVIVVWVILDRREPFHSHFWLTLAGCGVSAGLWGLILWFVELRLRARVKDGI
jgi:hypothetical protein